MFWRLLLLVPAICAPAIAWADPVFPPGSGVGIEPPPGMAVTAGVTDFLDGQASIAVTELPRDAFARLPGLGEKLQAGRQDGTSSDFAVGDARGFISRGQLEVGGRELRLWTVWLETSSQAVFIAVKVPASDQRITSASVETALRTITFRDAVAERLSVLPFTIGDLQGFRPVTLGYPGRAMLKDGILELTQGPVDPQPFAAQPVVMIFLDSRVRVPDAGRLDYAKRALTADKSFSDLQIVSARTFEVNGTEWTEISAMATQLGPKKVLLLMRLVSPPNGLIEVICSVPASDPADYSERFRKLAFSVQPRG